MTVVSTTSGCTATTGAGRRRTRRARGVTTSAAATASCTATTAVSRTDSVAGAYRTKSCPFVHLTIFVHKDGMIWISWPKKAAKLPTDVTEDVIREIILPLGLVDVKVCAVDATWSGLKLVIRKENRG